MAGKAFLFLFINFDSTRSANVEVPLPKDVTTTHNAFGRECLLFEVTSPNVRKKNELYVNGIFMELDDTGGAMELEPRHLLKIGKQISCGGCTG